MIWTQIFQAIAKGGGNLMAANADFQTVKAQGDQAAYSAKQAEQQGQDQARMIRRAGRTMVGAERAGYAASGVQVGEGSAGEVERQTVVDTEHDAFQAILGGQRQALALRTQAKLAKISSKAALTSTLIDPLNSNTGAMQGWKTYNPGYQGSTQLNSGNSYLSQDGNLYANNDLSGTARGSGD